MTWKTDTYTGWGRVHSASGELARPERQSALLQLTDDVTAPAIGMRRSYGDAPLNNAGRAIDMTRLDRIISYDAEAGLLEAEAGVQIGTLADILAPQGWLPAVMPGTGFATLGGCIANDAHGKNHHLDGSFGDHVENITLLLPGGERKTLTANRNKTLFRATIGGLGQTGVILSAKLRLKPCTGDVIMVTEQRAENFDAFISLLDNSRATYSVGWIDATARGNDLGRGILEEAETGAGLVPAPKRAKSVPFNAPGWALAAPIVKLFNALYYRRVPKSGRTLVKPIGDFFFPLDAIHNWNRLYGKQGFHQFQCVLPVDQKEELREMLELIGRSGLASPLAVLKRMGPGAGEHPAGMMSFPQEGYTLAVDFRNRPGAENLIRRLEEMTADAGGRIYLAKDSLASETRIKAMYPEHAAWCAIVNKHDPEGDLKTDLIRRLDLRTAQ